MIKKYLFFPVLIFSCCVTSCFAQPYKADTAKKPLPPNAYLGLGVGLDNYCGIIGVAATIRVIKPIYIRIGAGIGSWGSKVTATLLYKERSLSGWAMGVGYSYCTGLSNFSTSLQTVDTSGGTVNKNVNMTLLPASALNLTASYDWYFRNKNFFYLEFGYSLAMQAITPYRINDGSVLTSVSQDAIRIDSPGGFVLGVGFMFGL